MKGLKFSRETWHITANFTDATGLSNGTPVTFRGIQIGNVQAITFTPKDVKAKIRINSNDLVLFKPVTAKIETNSLLGGDAQISLNSQGEPINNLKMLPTEKKCVQDIILCEGDSIKGNDLSNMSKLAGDLNKFINDADKQEIIEKMVSSIEQFDSTQENLDELIRLSKFDVYIAMPII